MQQTEAGTATQDREARAPHRKHKVVKDDHHEGTPWRDAALLVLEAFAAVVLYCLVGSLVMSYEQDLTAVESIYFCVVTMSTVGYGDFSPSKESLRGFTIVWILVGIIFVFSLVSVASAKLTELIMARLPGLNLIQKLSPPKFVDIDGVGEADFEVPGNAFIYYFTQLIPIVIVTFLLQLFFAAIFPSVEDEWSYGDALYHCMVTATTVGYGDMAIVTEEGRVVATVHIIISVSLLGEIFGRIDELRSKRSKQLKLWEELETKLKPDFAETVIGNTEHLQHVSSVQAQNMNKSEFILGMLVSSGAATQRQIQPYEQLFNDLPSETGKVSNDKVKEGILEMQNSLCTLVKMKRTLSNLEKVAPEPQLTTAEKLENLEGQINEAVQNQGLDSVHVSVLTRQICLLKPIQFKGSMSSRDEVTFKDPDIAEHICKEVAVALAACNRLLVEADMLPFGLHVSGHTNGQEPAEEGPAISLQRATAVSAKITQQLAVLGVEGTEIVPEGFGSTQRLPGYDDGGLYTENRRVEIRLTFPDD